MYFNSSNTLYATQLDHNNTARDHVFAINKNNDCNAANRSADAITSAVQKAFDDLQAQKKGFINADIKDYLSMLFDCDPKLTLSNARKILEGSGFSQIKLIGRNNTSNTYIFRAEKLLVKGFSSNIYAFIDFHTKQMEDDSEIEYYTSTISDASL